MILTKVTIIESTRENKVIMGLSDIQPKNKGKKEEASNSSVNVIYFTNQCNLACTYCYQDLKDRPVQILSKEDIRNAVDEILEREPADQQTLMVLFGGEPTLEWENVTYLMDYAYSKKKKIHFNMTTNGIKFLSEKFLKKVMDNFFYKKGMISTDVSFDGLGNDKRVFENGDPSTPSMIKIFKKLNKYGFKYRIRYTIQKSNIDFLYKDIKKIINTFRPIRLITSVDWEGLEDLDQVYLREVTKILRKDWESGEIKTPVCEMFCDMCNGCDSVKKSITYYSDEGNVGTVSNSQTQKKFDDFKDKE